MKKLLIIVPTRERVEKMEEFYEAFSSTSLIADLCVGLDDDDEANYPRKEGVIYEVNPRLRMNGTLNLLAKKYADEYEYIGFLGDDHRPRTRGWDKILVEEIEGVKHGIVYGNDLFQGQDLPTSVILNASIIRVLGYMSPPALTHLYLDNFWKDLGKNLGSLFYRDDVIIEHMHFSLGKSKADDLYMEVNDPKMFHRDRTQYQQYLQVSFQGAITSLRES